MSPRLRVLLQQVRAGLLAPLPAFCAAALALALLQAPAQAAPRRLKDSEIASYLHAYEQIQTRIGNLAAEPAADLYLLAKAHHWLECSRSELSFDQRSPLIPAAFEEATNLVVQLEQDRPDINRETTIFEFVPSIRPDLWQLAADLKRQPNFATGQVQVARLEVQLVWAAHHYKTLGWRAAKPTLEKAEEYAAAACAAMDYKRPVFHAAASQSETALRSDQPMVLNLDALQDRLRELNARGLPLRSYAFAKAQHWLDFARAQDDAKDRSGIIKEAARQVQRIIQELEAGNPQAGFETPLYDTVKKVRPDLWEQAEAMKKHPAFESVADRVAKLEVQLVWAGHEYGQLGWRTARPHVAAAERLAKEAQASLQAAAPVRPETNS